MVNVLEPNPPLPSSALSSLWVAKKRKDGKNDGVENSRLENTLIGEMGDLTFSLNSVQ
jgi:hypothetical protein